MIINRRDWKSLEWKSIGLSVEGPFVVVWFSDTEDKTVNLNPEDYGFVS